MSRFALALVLLLPSLAFSDASLYLAPEQASYHMGEIFEVQIRTATGGESVSAAEADLTFDAQALAIERVSKEGSILVSFSTEPTYSNSEGTLSFAGWTREPYTGNDALLLTIRFRALRNMVSNAHLVAGAVLAADGHGSNIVSTMHSGVYTVEPSKVIPEILAAATSADEEREPPVTPILTDSTSSLTTGERIVARGHTSANADVVFTLSGESGESTFVVRSASDGSFTFVSEPLDDGVYRLWALAQFDATRTSAHSERLVVTVAPTGVAALFSSAALLADAAFPLLALLIAAGIAGGYLYHRHRLLVIERS